MIKIKITDKGYKQVPINEFQAEAEYITVPFDNLQDWLDDKKKKAKAGRICKCGNTKDPKYNQCWNCYQARPEIKL